MKASLAEKQPATQACPKKFTPATLPRRGEKQQCQPRRSPASARPGASKACDIGTMGAVAGGTSLARCGVCTGCVAAGAPCSGPTALGNAPTRAVRGTRPHEALGAHARARPAARRGLHSDGSRWVAAARPTRPSPSRVYHRVGAKSVRRVAMTSSGTRHRWSPSSLDHGQSRCSGLGVGLTEWRACDSLYALSTAAVFRGSDVVLCVIRLDM